MRARDVVGRRVVAVEQQRVWDQGTGGWVVHVHALVLDNGARLAPVVLELEDDYAVELLVVKPRKEGGA